MRISDWSSDVCSSDLLYQQLIRLIGEDMAGRFDGKVALVTAAVDGIGAATAQAFGENGARVILADINADRGIRVNCRSEEHTSELQSLMRTSYAVFCLKKNTIQQNCRKR